MKELCPVCGHAIGPRKERLTRGLMVTFYKFCHQMHASKKNALHLQDEVNLNKNEYNNFQKLRYHGLVQSSDAGYWSLTETGKQFINGEVSLPRTVFVKNNRVINTGSDLVFFKNFFTGPEGEPYWEKFRNQMV